MSSERVVELPDVAATHRLAAELAAGLRAGEVLALVGDLGAGKTELVRGLVAALGAPADTPVCSPSFVLLNLYPGGRLPVAHYDACFMDGTDDLERAGLFDLLRQGWVAAIEWADRVGEALPPGTRWVTLEPAGADVGARRARVSSRPPVGEAT